MAKRFDIEAQALSSAPIHRVWKLLSEQEQWPSWSGFESVVIEEAGDPVRDGVGAVRRTKLGRTIGREEVTRFDAPHTYGYRLLSGLPIRNYEALVMLNETSGGTQIKWQSTFQEKIPFTGAMVARRLQTFLNDLATRLAAAAAT
jgi:uncharacterized protein YndB with AHSA1/START domain